MPTTLKCSVSFQNNHTVLPKLQRLLTQPSTLQMGWTWSLSGLKALFPHKDGNQHIVTMRHKRRWSWKIESMPLQRQDYKSIISLIEAKPHPSLEKKNTCFNYWEKWWAPICKLQQLLQSGNLRYLCKEGRKTCDQHLEQYQRKLWYIIHCMSPKWIPASTK